MSRKWRDDLVNDDPFAALNAIAGAGKRKPKDGGRPGGTDTVLPLGQITMDKKAQPREAIDRATVEAYAAEMRDGVKFPPVTVFYDGQTYWLADGFHRVLAAQEANVTALRAEVFGGDLREAVLYSVGANAKHGLRRTNADKRRAVLTLLSDEEWGTWSDREIARQCGVDHKTVGRIRGELTGEIPQLRQYTDKHGNVSTMDTSGLTRADRRAVRVRKIVDRLLGFQKVTLPELENKQEKQAVREAIQAARERLDELEAQL